VIETERAESIKRRGDIPRHVAVIMDGNGRWARTRGLSRIEGHKEGIKSVRAAVETAGSLDIKTLTLYTFSSENWARPKAEVSALMSLLLRTIKNEVEELDEKNVRLMTIGDIDALPVAPRTGIRNTINRLSKNTGLVVNLALSYSGRQEIVDAVKRICEQVKNGDLSPQDIDEVLISRYMQTSEVGDPDLMIRTSGEMRISNFLLWQLAYTELYITPTLWPDFRHDEFYTAIEAYQKRERRYGKVSEQLDSD
jgi:undecaprenyl diphosphate synthase